MLWTYLFPTSILFRRDSVAMFDFIKGLSVFRIVTEPCAGRFLLLDGLSVALHHALDVGGF